ncbi:MAG: arsenite methyltransferase [Pirellulaceae bacterium]
MHSKHVVDTVQLQYAAVARSGISNDSAEVRAVAAAFGYSEDELASLPAEANMGLSCGNPVALAGLRAGEVVVDLGCGGGIDVLLAARRVGPTGKAIGIDMTPEMLERARISAAKAGLTNVDFHCATIDRLPLPDASVDCVVSNCVINLAPDKVAVAREILRVLKPGGRVAISDIALRQALPPELARDVSAYVGCIAGAILIDDYAQLFRDAGFESVVVSDTGADLNAYAEAGGAGCCAPANADAQPATASNGGSCCSPSTAGCCEEEAALHDQLANLFQRYDVNAYAASVRIHALKRE